MDTHVLGLTFGTKAETVSSVGVWLVGVWSVGFWSVDFLMFIFDSFLLSFASTFLG